MTHAAQVVVHDPAQLSDTINVYVMQGFTVASREGDCVTLVKRKQFSVVWAVVGFFFCLLPLVIYLLVYAFQQDQVVMIRIVTPQLPQGPRLSPDRRYWWDGAAWRDTTLALPPGAPRSPDGTLWWDGMEWRPVQRAIEG